MPKVKSARNEDTLYCDVLVRILDTIKPALADHGIHPVMEHFWFLGDQVVTYNDNIGMSAPLQTEFKGAAPGHLLQLLKASKSKLAVTLEPHEQDFDVRVGNYKTGTFPFLPIEDLPEMFTMPEPSTEGTQLKGKLGEFRRAIESCLLSVGHDTSNTEYRGITFIPEKDKLKLYGTDSKTFSRAEINITSTGNLKSRVIVPRDFLEVFLLLTKGLESGAHFEVSQSEEHGQYAFADVNGIRLFSKLLEPDRPTPFDKVFKDYFYDNEQKNLVDIPPQLKVLVDRAMVVTDSDVDQVKSELEVQDNVLFFKSESKRGIVDDQMGKFKHADVGPVKLPPKLLKQGLDYYGQITLTERVVILADDKRVYMISTTG